MSGACIRPQIIKMLVLGICFAKALKLSRACTRPQNTKSLVFWYNRVMKKVIGITGGIASGKSTVVDFLISLGYAVIDADKLVRRLQAPNGRLNRMIADTFGADFFDEEQQLNRAKLGQLIFSDSKAREKLAGLQNQIIREELYKERDALLQRATDSQPIFMDIPLLFEQAYDGFDEVWLVAVDKETQIERLIARDHLTREEALARIAAQMPLAQKMQLATRVIDSSGEIEATREIVKAYLQSL